MTENEIATAILDAAFKIHRALGPGLLESVYQATLGFELQRRGLRVIQQVGLPVHYEGMKLDIGFRVDLIVADKVIIEIKSVEALAAVHRKATADVSASHESAPWITPELQRGVNEGWHSKSC